MGSNMQTGSDVASSDYGSLNLSSFGSEYFTHDKSASHEDHPSRPYTPPEVSVPLEDRFRSERVVPPDIRIQTDDMDSQPATQPYTDPRRLGRNNSGLSEADLSDVLCILQPNSRAACKIVSALAKVAPQHILQNEDLLQAHDDADAALDPYDDDVSRAIALRMSSEVKSRCMGFVFGRLASTVDVLLCKDDEDKSLSAQHFRIFVNSQESLMIQDMSTNGIWYDDLFLTRKENPNAPPGRRGENGDKRMVTSGSSIRVSCGRGPDEIKFLVRIPSRTNYEDAFQLCLEDYLNKVQEAEYRQKNPQAPPIGGGLFPDIVTPAATGPPPPWKSCMNVRNHLPKGWDGGQTYNIIGTAGKGAFATVWKIATKRDGDVYAAKEISKRQLFKNGVFDRKIDSELHIMQQLRHKHIVRYIEHLDHHAHLYIVMEFVPGGDLSTLISEKGPLPEEWVKVMAWQTSLALRYLHKRRITHRDIKPDNILLVSEDPVNVKISDFGLSKVIDNQDTMLKTFCGTLLYCAPEVFSKYPEYLKNQTHPAGESSSSPHSYNQACDTWSFAAVLFMALTGKAPFTAESGDRDFMLDKIMSTRLNVHPLTRHGVSAEGTSFIRKLLNIRPQLRPTDDECLEDEWFQLLPEHMKSDVNADDDEYEAQGIGSALDEALGQDASQLSIQDRSPDGGHDDLDPAELPHGHHDFAKRRTPPQDFTFLQTGNEGGRLFGEVGSSAIGSSGVFPDRGPLSLGVSGVKVNGDEVNTDSGTATNTLPPSRPLLHPQSYSSHKSISDNALAPSHPVTTATRPNSAAPSLFGAEAMVTQLNVASSQDTSPSPTTPVASPDDSVPAPSPTPSHKRLREDDDVVDLPTGNAGTNSRNPAQPPAKFVRRINLPIPDSYYYDPYDRSTHTAEHAAKMRALDIANAGGPDSPAAASFAGPPPNRQSHVIIRPSTSFHPAHHSSMPPPSPLLGRLSTTPTSFCHPLTLALTQRETSWGRGGANSLIYANATETRIPKYAFDILFWAPGLTAHLAAGGDWKTMPCHATIKTRTKQRMWVNGVELRAAVGAQTPYGKIYSGDVITVCRAEGKKHGLQFVCEFFHGPSAGPRPRAGGDAKAEGGFQWELARFGDGGATAHGEAK